MRQCIVWALLATFATTATATARAQEPAAAPEVVTRAKQHYEAGRALYELGKYDQALVEFDEGFRLAPRPNFLVNMAQCHRRLGRTAEARALYEKFLAAAPDGDPMRPEVRRILTTLDTEPLAPGAAAPATVVTPAPRRAWYRDPVGGVLLAGGVAAVIVGIVLVTVTSVRISHAGDSYEDFLVARSAPDERTAGAVVLAGGAVLVAGAAIRYSLVRF
jgi:tetratricopeptide (TPR) repeat protein